MRLALWCVAGGVLGFFAEGIHRSAGVWQLPQGAALPLWIAPVYMLGLAAAALGFRALERRAPAPVTTRGAAVNAALLVALFLAPPLLHRHELLLTAVALAAIAARAVFFLRPGDLLLIVAVPLFDAAVEGALVAAGLFRYAHASLGPFPLWLAPLWASLGLCLRRLFRWGAP